MKELKGVVLSSDAFFPFRDSVDRAVQVSLRCLRLGVVLIDFKTNLLQLIE